MRQVDDEREIATRIAILRQVKAEKAFQTGSDKLTENELDRVIAPIDCYRTRYRSALRSINHAY